jgi:hypothetical protein
MKTTKELSEGTKLLQAKAKQVKENFSDLLLNENVTMNSLIVEIYKIETGAEKFETFKTWKENGMMVKKGEKGFPVFSRPSKAIKEEQGKNTEGERSYFFTAYLFNELQVQPIEQK